MQITWTKLAVLAMMALTVKGAPSISPREFFACSGPDFTGECETFFNVGSSTVAVWSMRLMLTAQSEIWTLLSSRFNVHTLHPRECLAFPGFQDASFIAAKLNLKGCQMQEIDAWKGTYETAKE
ncbi:hypothetical protein C8J56DRAFT_894028 [Mycena floridula]|nr:hypothetical protein C8J56DRAFT_894028 [Mycena floridula]